MITSVNISPQSLHKWQHYAPQLRAHLLKHCNKLTRLRIRRDCAIRYNRSGREYQKLSVRFSPLEYNALRHASQALRISVSRIVDFVIRNFNPEQAKGTTERLLGSYHFEFQQVCGRVLEITESWRVCGDPHKNLPPPPPASRLH